MTTLTFPLPSNAIWQFCRRWHIRELALLGSVLHANLRPRSGVDVLVACHDDVGWGLLSHIHMPLELATLRHRPLDLMRKRALEGSPNRMRREAILNTARVLVSIDGAGDGPR